MSRGITTLAPWYGGNRMMAHHVGAALDGCSWVGIVFAGGMPEVPHIRARTLLVNDLHRHVINLARVVADDGLRPLLVRHLARRAFHPDELRLSQLVCKDRDPDPQFPDVQMAAAYFVCCWMGRSGKAGSADEFNGRPSVRWKSDGGDSMVRYQSALRALVPFSQSLRRCTFETMDAFDFLDRCEDLNGHGIYCDPPFPEVGRHYKHNSGNTDELAWHTILMDRLLGFQKARIVCRFYDHPMIRTLYPEGEWVWHRFTGRTQANNDAPEVLVVRNGPRTLFSETP